jgi:DNA-binding transcriptional MerR regulator
MAKRTVSKGARLLLLRDLKAAGLLEGLTLQEIGDALGHNRSTIMRDLNDLEQVEREHERIMSRQPWLKRELNTAEFAEALGWEPETVRAMIREGLIKATMQDNGFYRMTRHELNRWRLISRTR